MLPGSSAPYEIVRSDGRCASSGEPLGPGARVVASLVEVPGESALRRIDFAAEAWEAGARPEPPLELFGFWRTVVAEPNENRRDALIGQDDLMDLFMQLGAEDSAEPRRAAFRYLLALILIRKRALVYEGSTRPDTRNDLPGLMRLRPKGVPAPPNGPPLIEVIDPGLDDDAIAGATEQLGRVMDLGEDGAP